MPLESQIPTASHHTSKRFAVRLALFYGAAFGLIGTHLPFFPVWLKAVGIDASWIGIITAVPSVTRFSILPLVTGLAERRQSLRAAIVVTGDQLSDFVRHLVHCSKFRDAQPGRAPGDVKPRKAAL